MRKRILFIGHDANFAGAQYLLLHLLTFLKNLGEIETLLVLGAGGGLENEFKAVTEVVFWAEGPEKENSETYLSKIERVIKIGGVLKSGNSKSQTLRKIEAFDPDFIFSNTIANGEILMKLDYLEKPFFIYCHELEKSIKTYSKSIDLAFQLKKSTYIFTGSKAVMNNLVDKYHVPNEKISVYPSYIDCNSMETEYKTVDRQAVKQNLGIPADAIIIGGCGLIEWRKGIDIFNYTALQVFKASSKNVHFVWVGVNKKSEDYYHLKYDLNRMGIAERVHLIEGSADIINYTACFDLFYMSSREDPYPLVMIEAGLNKIPVVCFANSGGAVDFVGNETELVIPYLDIQKAAIKIAELASNNEKRIRLGHIFYKKAWEHDISVRGPEILRKIVEFENADAKTSTFQ